LSSDLEKLGKLDDAKLSSIYQKLGKDLQEAFGSEKEFLD
jgi:hypothetical protein